MTVTATHPAPVVDTADVFSGARWLAVGQAASQLARLVVTVVLARLLAPAEFGLMSMAGVFTAFAWLFATLGTGPLVVQRRELPETLLRSLTTLGICMGLVLTAALALAAVPIARFYGEPRVVWIVVALAASFALTSIGLVPEGLLQRNLQFSRLVMIDAAQMVVASVVSIVLAAAGWGAWSLVTGNLLGMAVRSGALVASSPWRVRLGFDLQATRGVVGFGASVMGFNVVHYAARYTDRLLIGRMLGATSLGYYDYAYRFYMYPLEVITSVLMRLMFPTFARMQGDRAQLGRAFLRTNGAIALIAFPLMGGLAVVADPFVRVVLGDKWAPIISLVQILAPMAMLQALGATPGQLFLACGKAAFRFWWSVIYTTIIVTAVAVGVRWGIQGVATAYVAVMFPIIIVAFWLALRLVDLGLIAIWRTLRATVIATLAMVMVTLMIRIALERMGLPALFVLITCVAAGAGAYVALGLRLRPEAVDDLHRLLPESVRRHSLVTWLFATPAAPVRADLN